MRITVSAAVQVRRGINRAVDDQIVRHQIDIAGDDDHGRPRRASVEHRRAGGLDDLRFPRDERLHRARTSLDEDDIHIESLPLEKTRVFRDPQWGGAANSDGLIGSHHLVGGTRGYSAGEKKNQRADEQVKQSGVSASLHRVKIEF